MKPQKIVASFFDRTISFFFFLSAVFLIFLMVAVTTEVVARYFFNRPQMWVVESCEDSLLYITFLGTAWLLRKEGHVKIDIVTNRLNPRTDAVVHTITSLMGVVISLIIAWYGVLVTWDLFQKRIYAVTPLEPPLAAIVAVIPVGGFLLLIQFLRRSYNDVERWRGSMRSETKL